VDDLSNEFQETYETINKKLGLSFLALTSVCLLIVGVEVIVALDHTPTIYVLHSLIVHPSSSHPKPTLNTLEAFTYLLSIN
jgi:hypothetical protein